MESYPKSFLGHLKIVMLVLNLKVNASISETEGRAIFFEVVLTGE